MAGGDRICRGVFLPFPCPGVFSKGRHLICASAEGPPITIPSLCSIMIHAFTESLIQLSDFFRFGAKCVEELYSQQPPENAQYPCNRLEYRHLEGFVLAISPSTLPPSVAAILLARSPRRERCRVETLIHGYALQLHHLSYPPRSWITPERNPVRSWPTNPCRYDRTGTSRICRTTFHGEHEGLQEPLEGNWRQRRPGRVQVVPSCPRRKERIGTSCTRAPM